MNKFFLIFVVSLACVSCESQDTRRDYKTEVSNDNTGKNIRDRNNQTKTPFDQSESEPDRTVTQKIRQSIMDDSELSTNAKNIKIITIEGVVTLRGPVNNEQEREVIIKKVNLVPGIKRVDNQLEVVSQ